MLKQDRMSLYSADLLRSGFFILTAGVLWMAIKTGLHKYGYYNRRIINGFRFVFRG
jgi:hypothetical protein